jgi:hypothetical protein
MHTPRRPYTRLERAVYGASATAAALLAVYAVPLLAVVLFSRGCNDGGAWVTGAWIVILGAAVGALAFSVLTLGLAVAAAAQRLKRAAAVGAAAGLGTPLVGFLLLVLLFVTVIGPCLD